MKTTRPTVLSIAIILLFLLSLLNMLANFLPDDNPDAAPLFVEYGIIVLGVLALVAAFGLFKLKRWGMLLAVSVSVLNAFLWVGAIPADSPLIKGFGVMLVALNTLIIVLVVLPSMRQTSTA
jgi:uncharacterized membrane protein (DUF2068 family)